jgi:hypothetical protein
MQRQQRGDLDQEAAKGKAQPSLREVMGEGDAGRDRDHTTDSQRDPQAPIHLSGASTGHERDDRARRDKGEPKALAFDLADAEEGGQGRRHDQCSANPEQPRYDATNDPEWHRPAPGERFSVGLARKPEPGAIGNDRCEDHQKRCEGQTQTTGVECAPSASVQIQYDRSLKR